MSDATQTASTTQQATDATTTTADTGSTTAATTTATTAADTGKTTDGKATDTTTAKADDGKDGKADDKPAGAPEKYADFKLPEGVKGDDASMGEFTSLAKELNLSQEQAQKLVDLNAKFSQGSAENLQATIAAQAEKWGSDSKADKEFGGDKFDENLAVAKRALDQFGTPELKSLLNDSKLGNHPEVLRFFVRAGKAISEDGFVQGKPGNGSGKSIAQQMYPNMNP